MTKVLGPKGHFNTWHQITNFVLTSPCCLRWRRRRGWPTTRRRARGGSSPASSPPSSPASARWRCWPRPPCWCWLSWSCSPSLPFLSPRLSSQFSASALDFIFCQQTSFACFIPLLTQSHRVLRHVFFWIKTFCQRSLHCFFPKWSCTPHRVKLSSSAFKLL